MKKGGVRRTQKDRDHCTMKEDRQCGGRDHYDSRRTEKERKRRKRERERRTDGLTSCAHRSPRGI